MYPKVAARPLPPCASVDVARTARPAEAPRGREGSEDVPYTEQLKEQMVRRMMGPEALSATTLSKQVGVTQSTLSKWLKWATLGAMTSEAGGAPVVIHGGARRPGRACCPT